MATTKDAPTATSSLLTLPPEERRKILLESLQEGYPCIPRVSRPVSSRVSRYVSQFTSGRWRERIWFSDESVGSEDLEKEMSTSGRGEPQLVIFGHNLHSEDYLKEREMMARWNIVERELHFPDLEKGYVQKRDAKTQSDAVLQPNIQTSTTKDADVVTEPTEGVPMEECKESPQKADRSNENSPTGRGPKSSGTKDTEDSPKGRGLKSSGTKDDENSPTGRGLKSSVGSDQTPTKDADVVTEPTTEDVPMEECKESPQKVTGDNENSPTGRGLKSSVTEDSPTGRGPKSSVTEDNENSPTGRGLKSSVGSGELHSKVEEMLDQSIKSKKCKINEGQSVSNTGSSVSKDVKEVSAVPDPKLAKSAKTETSDANSAESGAKTSDPNSKSLEALLEAKEPVEKMDASTIPGDSSVEKSEKVLGTSTASSTEEKMSVLVTQSSEVSEVEGPADKMDTESVPEQMNIARTSETDVEATGTNLRGKRKADSVTEDDPVEKRTKKTSAE